MNDHRLNIAYNDNSIVPDGAHRHTELEKVQKEILNQHKYLETQLNMLRDNIRSICSTNGMSCDFATFDTVNSRPLLDRVPSRYINNFNNYNNLKGVRKF
uniref:Uncharacterized protein n=1 Tax=Cryptophlebia leucotreta granulosis virus TaxID=35254 RepID=A0A2H4ZKI6_GVCL|nr:hypothetical protein [Cryptophlebia leucotreta granulovirus]